MLFVYIAASCVAKYTHANHKTIRRLCISLTQKNALKNKVATTAKVEPFIQEQNKISTPLAYCVQESIFRKAI